MLIKYLYDQGIRPKWQNLETCSEDFIPLKAKKMSGKVSYLTPCKMDDERWLRYVRLKSILVPARMRVLIITADFAVISPL